MSVTDHERYEQDIGAYLLGALTDSERAEFERHAEGCASCRREVEELRPATDALPRSVPQLAAPPGLKRSLMDVVEREAAEASGTERRTPLSRRLAARLPRLSGARPALALAGAGLVLAIGVAGGFGLAGVLSGDDTRTVTASVDRSRLPSGTGRVSIDEGGDDGAILRVHGMPSPGRGRVYQAWVQRDGAVEPQPTFEVGRDGNGAVAVPEDLSEADAVLVTRERRGGARAPSEPPVMRAGVG